MSRFTSMTHVVRSQVDPCLRLAWFLLEALEREQRLNLRAMAGTPGAFLDAWLRIAASGVAPAPRGRGLLSVDDPFAQAGRPEA